MKYFYSLRIECDEIQKNIISIILGIQHNTNYPNWCHEIIHDTSDYFDFIQFYYSILESNYNKLNQIGIKKQNITIWLIYAYEDQCNIEFSPRELELLNKLGISFCISCYEEDYISSNAPAISNVPNK